MSTWVANFILSFDITGGTFVSGQDILWRGSGEGVVVVVVAARQTYLGVNWANADIWIVLTVWIE